jgi:lysophospholipid acyltransferase (LPLAT)-like uncharacterized protein
MATYGERFTAASSDTAVLRRHIYGFANLQCYSFWQRLVIRVAGVSFWILIALIGRTLRWVAVDVAAMDEMRRAGKRFVGAFWHNRVFLATWFFRQRGIVVLTSQSFDGEYIARFIQRFGYGAARGSSRRGGVRALRELVVCLRNGLDAAFTIDGPTGPRYVAKAGAVQLAALTGAGILPFGIAAEHYWEVPNWDRFQVPKPFSRAVVFIGSPIYVERHGGDEALARARRDLQAALGDLRTRSDGWWVVHAPLIDACTAARV